MFALARGGFPRIESLDNPESVSGELLCTFGSIVWIPSERGGPAGSGTSFQRLSKLL